MVALARTTWEVGEAYPVKHRTSKLEHPAPEAREPTRDRRVKGVSRVSLSTKKTTLLRRKGYLATHFRTIDRPLPLFPTQSAQPAWLSGGEAARLAASTARYERAKRVLDVCLATLAMVLLSPVFLLVAIGIFLEDPGPVIFRQRRVGRGGREFDFFKFRSMVRDAESRKGELAAANEAEGPNFKIRRDPRVTRVGRLLRKYSLDELPQFYNVLRGDMSLVGPRPHVPEEVDQYTPEQWQRLTVPSGLICLREIGGRSELSFETWIELDLQYIRKRSLVTDFEILLGAIPAVFRGTGAY